MPKPTPATGSSRTTLAEDPQTALPHDTKLPPFFSLRFSTRAFALGLNVVVLLQLTFYATDTLGLAPGVVGGLFLAAKLFDGVTDLAVGFFIDRTNTRWGKARPYELFLIPLWLLTIAIFSTPEMDPFWQGAYLFVLFALINSVCATFLNASEAVYLKRSIRGDVKYAKVLSRQGVLVILVSVIGSILLPQLMATWGTQPGGWTMIAAVYGIPLTLIGLVRFFTIKELPEDEMDRVTEERLGVKATLRALLANRYVFVLGLLVLLANIVISTVAVVGAYYYTYILGNLALLSLGAIAGLIVPVAYLVFPVAVRTIGALNFVRVGLGIAIVGYAMVLIAPTSLPVVIGGSLLGSFTSVITLLVGYFMIQAMAYGEWKTGKRIDAVTNTIAGFAGKVGQGIAAGGVGIIMTMVGYNGLADTQTAAAESAIVSLFALMPLIVTVIMLAVTYLYKVEKHMGAIQADLAAGIHADTSTTKI